MSLSVVLGGLLAVAAPAPLQTGVYLDPGVTGASYCVDPPVLRMDGSRGQRVTVSARGAGESLTLRCCETALALKRRPTSPRPPAPGADVYTYQPISKMPELVRHRNRVALLAGCTLPFFSCGGKTLVDEEPPLAAHPHVGRTDALVTLRACCKPVEQHQLTRLFSSEASASLS